MTWMFHETRPGARALTWAGALILMASACGEAADRPEPSAKEVEGFSLGEVSLSKGDETTPLLNASQVRRLEGSLLAAIDQLNAQIAKVEQDIRASERDSERKRQEILAVERDIASREDELRRQADRNLLLCALFPDPATCSVVVLIENDRQMKDYKYKRDKVTAERQLIERKIADYRRDKATLSAQIDALRQSKDRLIEAYTQAKATGGLVQGASAQLSLARARVDLLERVHALTQQELLRLQAIHALASNLGVELDRVLLVVGQLAQSVDDLIADSEALFMDLLIEAIFPGQQPSTVQKLKDAQIKAAVDELLAQYDWPMSQLLRHAMGMTGESSDKLYQDIMGYYATRRFERTVRPEAPLLDHQTVDSSMTVPESLKPSEVFVRVSVTHDARGDLVVSLRHQESGAIFALHTHEGGLKKHLRRVYTLDASKVQDTKGTWTLTVQDSFAQDEGKLVYWTLSALERPEAKAP